jgi:hypothetical protein
MELHWKLKVTSAYHVAHADFLRKKSKHLYVTQGAVRRMIYGTITLEKTVMDETIKYPP